MGESISSRQRKRQLLARRNRGQTEFKAYAGDLGRLLRTKITDADRLNVEATDQLFAAHVKQYQESKHQPQHCFQQTWAMEPTEVWSKICARTGGALCGAKGVLFVGTYEYSGAVRVDVERALQVAPVLLEFDGDTLAIAAMDGRSGLSLDRHEEHSEWFVELVVWGEWAQAIASVVGD